MVTPAVRREAAAHLQIAFEVSERRACSALGADRTSVRYRGIRPDDAAVRTRLRELAAVRRRFGYRRLHILLAREGIRLNHKKLRRLYREERLQGASAQRPQARAGNQGADGDPAGAQSALEHGLRVGRLHRRAALPHPVDRRRLHARVPGAGGRHVAAGTSGCARTQHARRSSRSPGQLPFRQRDRTHQHGDPALVAEDAHRVALHRPWQAPAERLRGELQWAGCWTNS